MHINTCHFEIHVHSLEETIEELRRAGVRVPTISEAPIHALRRSARPERESRGNR